MFVDLSDFLVTDDVTHAIFHWQKEVFCFDVESSVTCGYYEHDLVVSCQSIRPLNRNQTDTYLLTMASAGGRNFNFKVVLLGEGCVGKTSLVLRYVENKFNDKHLTTLQVITLHYF